MTTAHDREAWFAPKLYGYGAGLPIAWQGWALLALYLLVILGSALLFQHDLAVFLAIALVSTAIMIALCAATTRGGWRWRWGDSD